ncbi:MAG: DUF5320 domain-containing protein [Candidatus Omnitrophica bacterium]|nr:DUF5320 domain-containing protein [Candidatus Omnitrophota bacterium]
MPGFDGTGPQGAGPMTGGGRGYCAFPLSGNRPMYAGQRFFGRGGVRGRRNRYYATGLTGWQRAAMGMPFGFANGGPAFGGAYPYTPAITPKQETDILRNEAEFLRKQLEDIQGRIDALEDARQEKGE